MQKSDGGSGDSAKTTPKPPKTPIRGKTFMGLAGTIPSPTPAPAAPRLPSMPLAEAAAADEQKDSRIAKSEDHYYEPIEELGRGGMGIVYKAMQVMKIRGSERGVKRPVALKVINFGTNFNAREMTERFITEADLVSKLKQRNVIKLLDFGQTEKGELYYAMEFLEGTDLEIMMGNRGGLPRQRAIPWEEAKPIIEQVCAALDAAHSYVDEETGERRPIIHRDIKPANIFLAIDEDGTLEVKLLDFGLGKIQAKTGHEITQTGEGGMGTPEYMSPEQANFPFVVDHRADIYAVGALLYEMLAGRTPLPVETVMRKEGETEEAFRAREYQYYFVDVPAMIQSKIPLPLREAAPWADIPEELAAAVMKCLEKDHHKRYQNMRELREALSKCNGTKTKAAGVQDGTVPSNGTVDPLQTIIIDEDGLAAGPSAAASHRSDPRLRQPEAGSLAAVEQPISSSETRRFPNKRSPFRKWLAIGSAVAVLGGAAGLGYYKLRGPDAQQGAYPGKPLVMGTAHAGSDPLEEPRKPNPAGEAETDAGTVQAGNGQQRPDSDARGPVALTYTLTVRAGIPGVSVLIGNDTACVTGSGGTCDVSLGASPEQVELVFRKRGYRDARRSVTPDRDQSVQVEMERAPTKTRPPRGPRGPMVNDQGDPTHVMVPGE